MTKAKTGRTTTTISPSKAFTFVADEKYTRRFYIPLEPVAASRARVGKWGGYYSGPYAEFRKVAPEYISVILKEEILPLFDNKCIEVFVLLSVTPPASTTLAAPDPDNDNYEKAVFDQCNATIWDDDRCVICNHTMKMWATQEWPAGVYIEVKTNGQDFKRNASRKAAVSSMPKERRGHKRR